MALTLVDGVVDEVVDDEVAVDDDLHDVTDEELTAEALAADPDAPLGADAVPFAGDPSVTGGGELLPSWYMPAPVAPGRARSRRHKVGAMAVCLGLVGINSAGLCITYGHLVLA